MRHIEIEKKFSLPDPTALITVLTERGAIPGALTHQVDAYYNGAWMLDDVEVVLDHVVDAGDFVEFEFKGDAGSIEIATERLIKFIADLGVELGEPINRGYPHMLLGREH